MTRPLTPEVVIALPPCVTAKETQDIARFIEAAIAAAIARDREGLVREIAMRIHEGSDYEENEPGTVDDDCLYEARRLLALDAPEAQEADRG
jgi:hypothetical protein